MAENSTTLYRGRDFDTKEEDLVFREVLLKLKYKHGEDICGSWLQSIKFHSISDSGDTVNFSVPTQFTKQHISIVYLPQILDEWRKFNPDIRFAHIFVEKSFDTKEEEDIVFRGVLLKLKYKHGEDIYGSWLQSIKFHSISDSGDTVNFSVPTQFIKQHISTIYLPQILDEWRKFNPDIRFAHIFVEKRVKKDNLALSEACTQKETDDTKQSEALSSNVKKDSSFKNFVVGDSNKLAFSVCSDVAQNIQPKQFNNPVYMFGKPGVGKTHLIHAVYNSVKKQFPDKVIIYMTAENFMRSFIKAIKENDVIGFKRELRYAEIFMVDDIQFLCGKEHTEEEFFYTFSYLIDNGRQVLLSADRPPKDLKKIGDRLRSRLGNGIVVDIFPPERELRVQILREKLQGVVEEEKIDEVVEYISQQVTSSIREIEGAVNKIYASKMIFGSNSMTIQRIKSLLEPLVCKQKEINIGLIMSCVCSYFGITKKEIISKSRESRVVIPRQLAMYFAKMFTQMSNAEIGCEFGDRDHATVTHALKRISSLAKLDVGISKNICDIEEKIKQG